MLHSCILLEIRGTIFLANINPLIWIHQQELDILPSERRYVTCPWYHSHEIYWSCMIRDYWLVNRGGPAGFMEEERRGGGVLGCETVLGLGGEIVPFWLNMQLSSSESPSRSRDKSEAAIFDFDIVTFVEVNDMDRNPCRRITGENLQIQSCDFLGRGNSPSGGFQFGWDSIFVRFSSSFRSLSPNE